MGAGASINGADADEATELEAIAAMIEEYHKLEPGHDHAAAFDRLKQIYVDKMQQQQQGSGNEGNAPPPRQQEMEQQQVHHHPLVQSMAKMNEEEKEALAQKVLEAAIQEDKRSRRKGGSSNNKAGDYSQSFGGTALDTKVEKEFEAMMREAGGDASSSATSSSTLLLPVDPLLHPPPAEALVELRAMGKWMKFLSLSGCYMYVHSLTHEMVAQRPDDYDEALDGGGGGGNGRKAADDDDEAAAANGLPTCDFSEIPKMIEEVIEQEKKTPFFLDTSPERNLSSFFSYKSIMIDMSALAIGYAKTGIKSSDMMEKARQKLVSAMKNGQLLTLDLGHVTAAHANLKTKLCEKDVFPVEVFQEGGKILFTPNINPRYEKVFREEDLEQGQMMIKKEGFRFAVLSSLSPVEYEQLLEESLPLGYMKSINVKHSSSSSSS